MRIVAGETELHHGLDRSREHSLSNASFIEQRKVLHKSDQTYQAMPTMEPLNTANMFDVPRGFSTPFHSLRLTIIADKG